MGESEELAERRRQLGIFVQELDDALRQSQGLGDTVVELVVKGENGGLQGGGGRWLIVTQGGSGCVAELEGLDTKAHKEVQCVVTTDIKTLSKLANGEMKPAMALLRGRVSYSGQYGVFRNLQSPFRSAMGRALERIGPEGLGSHLASLSKAEQISRQDWTEGITFILDESHPEWVRDAHASRCKVCLSRFGFLSRKHHCRLCGSVVCAPCSVHRLKGNRVCSLCFQTTVAKQQGGTSSSSSSSSLQVSSLPATDTQSANLSKGKTKEKDAGEMLPFERLMVHVRALQDKPIGAAIGTTTMSLLDSTRRLLLKLRKVESTLAGYEHGRMSRALFRACLSMAPFLGVSFLLGWSWRTLLGSVLQASQGLSIRATATGLSFSVGMIIMFSHQVPRQLFALGVLGLTYRGLLNSVRDPIGAAKDIAESVVPRLLSVSTWTSVGIDIITTRPLLFVVLICASLCVTLAARFFGRLLKIYSTAFLVILSYYVTYLVFGRVMKLPESMLGPIFEQLDRVMAPFVCNEILELRSVFVKFGQYIGSRADIIPPHWGVVLAKLQDDMPFDSPDYVERCIQDAFGHKVQDLFESFDYTPMASASVAQVHKAVIKAGVCPRAKPGEEGSYIEDELEVAVKVQHEGIVEIMLSDVVAFRRIINFIAWLNPRFEVAKTLLGAWEKEMLKELDFGVEAGNLFQVRANLRSAGLLVDDDYDYADGNCTGSQVLVPKPIHAFVAKQAFCMTFIHGFKITDLDQLDLFAVDRCALVKRVVHAYSSQLYVDGFFNADPHPGNIMVSISEDGSARPILLDFGMVVEIPHEQRVGYCKLVQSIAGLSVFGVSEAIAQVGYKNSQSEDHPERDLEFFSFLLRDTGDRKSQRAAQAEFRKRRQQQRKEDLELDPAKEGRFFSNFPDSLIFLFRVLGLIRGLCTTLDAPISYIDIMGDYARLGVVHENLHQVAENEVSTHPSSSTSLVEANQSRLSSLSARERALQGQVSRIISQYASSDDSLAFRVREGFVVEGFHGGQVCCFSNGACVVDCAGGVLDELGPVHAASNSLFPMMDLSRVLLLLLIYKLEDENKVSFEDRVCKYWPGFYDKDLRIVELLSYSAAMDDIVKPTSSPGVLKNTAKIIKDIEAWKAPFVVGTDAEKTSQYQVFTFGYVLARLLEGVVGNGADIESIIGTFLKDTKCNTADDEMKLSLRDLSCRDRLARVANTRIGFAASIRGILMGGKLPTEFAAAAAVSSSELTSTFASSASSKAPANEPQDNREEEPPLSNPGQQRQDKQSAKESRPASASGQRLDKLSLPAGIMLDPCCVNSDVIRAAYVPSFGCFSSARAFCEIVDTILFKSISKRLLHNLTESKLRKESNILFGDWEWTFGLQRYEIGPEKLVVLCQHGFGGSLLLVVPDRRLVLVVQVNCLTLDRSFTKEVVRTILHERGITFAPQDLFKGMF